MTLTKEKKPHDFFLYSQINSFNLAAIYSSQWKSLDSGAVKSKDWEKKVVGRTGGN